MGSLDSYRTQRKVSLKWIAGAETPKSGLRKKPAACLPLGPRSQLALHWASRLLSHQNTEGLSKACGRQTAAAAPPEPGQAKTSPCSAGESPACSYTRLARALIPSCTLKRSKVDVSRKGKAIKG